ncbi:sensor domain-containing diguanylate cyclase [Maridesulfovibrio sp.]|uniref:transporter substrate-binding domain-containing diguanylate cyclase n=1 Tax=Maridesulfovibrio sp. TaxID=2795000 RepID=UPI002A18C7E2|nr:sensor domain-containing diguanylate cyclase [Maridesulfovibrio sp.]
MRIYILNIFLLLILAVPANAKEIPQTLTITNSNTWPPYSFTGENGEPRGLLIDLWREFGRRNKKKVEFILTDWSESLELLKSKKDIIHGGLYKSNERSEYMDFTEPLALPLNTRLFVSTKLNITKLSELGNIPLAVTKDGYAEAYIREKYPEIQLTPFPNENVISESRLAFATDYPAAMYHLHRMGAHDKFYVAETLYTKRLSVAVSKGNEDLRDFIEKGMKDIPDQEINRITQKWIQAVSITPDWLLPAAITAFCIMAGGFIFLYIFTLKRQVAARTKELREMSQTDMLTGLYNRRRMDEIMQHEFDRFRRYNTPLTLILIDIDYFKNINDTHGHTIGDDVLIRFAEILISSTRKTDRIGRWGGEEFLIVCSETTSDEGALLAEKLRHRIAEASFPAINKCTASFGITEINKDDDFTSLFARCDAALYSSKEQGRNKVTVV